MRPFQSLLTSRREGLLPGPNGRYGYGARPESAREVRPPDIRLLKPDQPHAAVSEQGLDTK